MKPVVRRQISLRPSRRLLMVQVVAHLAAIVALLGATLPSWLALLFLLLITASAAQARKGLRAGTLVLHGDGRLEADGPGGTPHEVCVHAHTLVLPFLVVLLYREDGRLRSLTLLADSLAEEDFRQLRLWLRWRSAATDPGSNL